MLQELGITKDDILDKVAEKVLGSISIEEDLASEIKKEVSSQLVVQAKEKIDAILNEVLGDLIDKPFTPVDEWGDPVRKKTTTLRQMVKDRSINFLTDKVDKDGKTASYNIVGSRAEWMARKAAETAIDYECKQELQRAVESAKADLRRLVANHITETILKR